MVYPTDKDSKHIKEQMTAFDGYHQYTYTKEIDKGKETKLRWGMGKRGKNKQTTPQ